MFADDCKQALPLILLYRQERMQYDVTVQKMPGKSPSEIYGAEHLLRVFGEPACFFPFSCLCRSFED